MDPCQCRAEVVVALCEHFLSGGEGARAYRYLDAALTALEDRYQNAGAAALAARALAVPDLLSGRERCEVLLRRAMRLDLAGHREEEAAALEEASRLSEMSGDPGLRARVLGRLGWHHMQAGDPSTARDLLAAAVELAADGPNRTEESGTRRRYGDVLHSLGEHEAAAHELERALALAVAAGDRPAEAKATGDLGLAMRSLSRVDEARRLQERCLALSRELGDRMGEAAAEGNLGVLLADSGDPEGSAHQERQLVLCREIGYRRGEAIATGNLGTRLFEQGRFEEARQRYERHLALSEEIGFKQGEAIAVGNLGVLFFQLGRLADAKAYDERHLALCREIGYRRGEAIAEGNLGDVCLLLGDTGAARDHIEGALERARALGSAMLESFALYSLARVMEQAGETDRVEPLYREALERRQSAGFAAGVPGLLIALGWWLVRQGRRDEARPMLVEALAAARDRDLVDEELLASVYLASLPGEGPEALSKAFTERSGRLGARIKMEIHHLLWTLTRDPSHLDAASRLLAGLQEGAPEAYRDRMIENVPLHRELYAARAARETRRIERGSRPEGTG
jgi:tetratricopeptide (TPR) repeat protein